MLIFISMTWRVFEVGETQQFQLPGSNLTPPTVSVKHNSFSYLAPSPPNPLCHSDVDQNP